MLRNKFLFFALCLTLSTYGQGSFDKSKYESAKNLVENFSINMIWGKESAFYLWEESGQKFLYKVELKTGKKDKVLAESTIKSWLRDSLSASEKELAKWNLYSYEIADEDQAIVFKWNSQPIKYFFKRKNFQKQLTASVASRSNGTFNRDSYWKKFNSDSTQYLFGKGHQLYLFDIKENKEYKLTTDGEPYFSYNNNNTTDTDTTKNVSTSAVWVGNKIVSWREDKRAIGEMAIINSLSSPRPTWRTYKFPMPGDVGVVQFDVKIWDAKTKQVKTIGLTPEKDQRLILPGQLVNGRTQLYAERLGTNTNYVYFLRRSRSNERVELCRLDFNNSRVEVVIDETTNPHVNEQLFSVHVFNQEKDILFWSERTGYGQYYHYNSRGKLLNKVGPKGDYVVSKIVDLDTSSRTLYLEVYGFDKASNPYYKQYLRCHVDTEKAYLLTPERADHQISFSKDKKYILNTFSTIERPHTFQIRNVNGKLISQLGTSDITKLVEAGWCTPEIIRLVAADDSTQLYGVLYKPSDFNANKKYPIITSVYPGPQDDFVPQSFTIDDNYHQSLADLGFVVVQTPSRGSSPYRGLQFHSYSFGNMRDYALADNKKAIEDLAKDRPYINMDQVGIFGHSGGGFMTATAMMTYPDFYKVGVAASGNYDPNIYTQWWSETYHGVNTTNKSNYIPTTIELAPQLKGKLLLITGDVDNNVHPAHTMRLAHALIKANKFFDMMILPGKDHGLGDWYYQSLIRNYFTTHLK